LGGERQAIDERVVIAFRACRFHILRVLGEDRLLAIDQRFGRRQQRAVARRGGGARKLAARGTRRLAHGFHHGGCVDGGVQVVHATSFITGFAAIPSASSTTESHGSPGSTPLI